MKNTNKDIPLNIKLGNFLLTILVILIVGTGSLVYYIICINQQELNQNSTEEQNVINEENIKNQNINSSITDSNTSVINTVDASNKNIMNENLIVLYNGLILDTTKMEKKELEYIDNSDIYKDKYVITYYNYENFSLKNSSLGILSQPIYEGKLGIDNVSKIAISEDYNAIPRDIKVVNAIPEIISNKNTNLENFDSTKVIITDLDGNGTEEYILILANKITGYSKIMLVDATGVKVSDLAYIEKNQWETMTTEEYYLSLNNVEIIDIDNDGTMEILIELPTYEGTPAVSLLKYKNGNLEGNKNIECSLLP